MKTCPNCGSKMEADVNFCTVCGTNIKDVPLDGAQPVEQPAPQAPVDPQPQPVQQTLENTASVTDTSNENSVQNNQSANTAATTSNQQINDTFSKVSSHITTAVKNFDKESLWKWFVTSWKTPSAQQQGEKWYGIATLLVEMILFSFGLVTGIRNWGYSIAKSIYGSNAISSLAPEDQSKISKLYHGGIWDVFLFVLILGIGVIVSSYFANKFVHNDNPSIFDYINKIVQMSNICAILVLVTSVLAFINLQGFGFIIKALIVVTALVFLITGAICVKDGIPTTRDSFYGVIIYIVAFMIFAFIAYNIVKNQMINQIQTTFSLDLGQLWNQIRNYTN